MRWPWQREVPESERGPSVRAPAPSPMGWAFLPPIQRSLTQTLTPLTRPTAFPHELSAWRDPSFAAPLTHLVLDTAPAGVIDADGAGVGTPSLTPRAGEVMTLLPPPRPQSVQRREAEASWGSTLTRSSSSGLPVVQRSVAAEPSAPDPAADPEPDPVVELQTPPAGEPEAESEGDETPVPPEVSGVIDFEGPATATEPRGDSPLPDPADGVGPAAGEQHLAPSDARPRLGLGEPLPVVPITASAAPSSIAPTVQRSTGSPSLTTPSSTQTSRPSSSAAPSPPSSSPSLWSRPSSPPSSSPSPSQTDRTSPTSESAEPPAIDLGEDDPTPVAAAESAEPSLAETTDTLSGAEEIPVLSRSVEHLAAHHWPEQPHSDLGSASLAEADPIGHTLARSAEANGEPGAHEGSDGVAVRDLAADEPLVSSLEPHAGPSPSQIPAGPVSVLERPVTVSRSAAESVPAPGHRGPALIDRPPVATLGARITSPGAPVVQCALGTPPSLTSAFLAPTVHERGPSSVVLGSSPSPPTAPSPLSMTSIMSREQGIGGDHASPGRLPSPSGQIAVAEAPGIQRALTLAPTYPAPISAAPTFVGNLPDGSTADAVAGDAVSVARAVSPVPTLAPASSSSPDQPSDSLPVQAAAAAAPAPAPAAAVTAPASGGADAGQATSPDRVEALAQRLIGPMLRRIKAEMLLDRERQGLRTDTW